MPALSGGSMAGQERFSSRWMFVLSAMGAAIGTGNIWRFPREAAVNGGGAFMIAWLVALFVWSIPLLMAEFALGRRMRLGVIGSFKALLGPRGVIIGSWTTWVHAAIMFYYIVVMGWVLRYVLYAADGTLARTEDTAGLFQGFLSDPIQVIGFQFLALVLCALVCVRGIRSIEKANFILLPLLVVMLVVAMLWALTLPGAIVGIRYLYVPDPAYLGRAETWVRAFAHSSWSVGVGMGIGITYGLYTKRREDTSLNAFLTGLGNNSVELVAGVAVLGTLFALSASVADARTSIHENPTGMTFIHLAALFRTMPGGNLVALLFFVATAFAALTSVIAAVEMIVRNLVDAGWQRRQALPTVLAALFVFGIPSALSVDFLENQDFVWGIGLLLSGLLFAGSIIWYGTDRYRERFINHRDNDIIVGQWWSTTVRYLVPLFGTGLLLWFVVQSIQANPRSWSDPFVTRSLGTLVVQWAAMFGLFWYLKDRISARIPAPPPDAEIHEDTARSGPGGPPPPVLPPGIEVVRRRIRKAVDALRDR